MKPLLPKRQMPESCDLFDADDYKSVFHPDVDSEAGILQLATVAFQANGYEVKAAKASPYHPVYVFKMKAPPGPPRFIRQRDFQAHLRQLLSRVGLELPKDAPLVERNGDRILVTFLWQPDARPGGRAKRIRRVPVGG